MGTIGKRRNKEEERKKEWKNERKGLTLTGLLMEGMWTIAEHPARKRKPRSPVFCPAHNLSSGRRRYSEGLLETNQQRDFGLCVKLTSTFQRPELSSGEVREDQAPPSLPHVPPSSPNG